MRLAAAAREDPMGDDVDVFGQLRMHLDRLAVGFPASRSGAEIRLLRQMFSPQQAALALHMSNRRESLAEIMVRAGAEFGEGQANELLDDLSSRGVILWSQADGVDRWHLQPLIVGMFETYQAGVPNPRFLAEVGPYVAGGEFTAAFLSSEPFQVRVVPVNQSIPVEHHIAHYDDIHALVEASPGPFAVLPCICRELGSIRGNPCSKTTRKDSCFIFGDHAVASLRHDAARELTREEALAHLKDSEQDGLVLQTSNAQVPDFVCACCSCCCGLLRMQHVLPRPADVWISDFQCTIDSEVCSQCEECLERCQVGALAMTGPSGAVAVDPARCIGCGLCVVTCPTDAMQLTPKPLKTVPPKDVETLFTESAANRARAVARMTDTRSVDR